MSFYVYELIDPRDGNPSLPPCALLCFANHYNALLKKRGPEWVAAVA